MDNYTVINVLQPFDYEKTEVKVLSKDGTIVFEAVMQSKTLVIELNEVTKIS